MGIGLDLSSDRLVATGDVGNDGARYVLLVCSLLVFANRRLLEWRAVGNGDRGGGMETRG